MHTLFILTLFTVLMVLWCTNGESINACSQFCTIILPSIFFMSIKTNLECIKWFQYEKCIIIIKFHFLLSDICFFLDLLFYKIWVCNLMINRLRIWWRKNSFVIKIFSHSHLIFLFFSFVFRYFFNIIFWDVLMFDV